MLSANEIRRSFLDFFASCGHEVIASSPLVPHQDPTLLFTNAGMVQFKNVFTGNEKRSYQRAVTSQKCVRAGGKHNDLENVGYTTRHHTFFEMLGNFSFGDYFKDQAIELAWALLTKEFQIPKERLLVTVYIDDDEAFELWKKIADLPENRILRIDGSDNYWSMGSTGPCGPCSEIFYDHGEDVKGGIPGSSDQDGDRFVEVWNLVFMQYELLGNGNRENLPKPSIDTGMGLERIAAVLQGKHDNYDTDIFKHIITASAEVSKQSEAGKYAISHRVVADHLRSSCFLIADGVMPSNEGRGYVLRRIMRRAMRHAHLMGTKDPLLWQLVPTLIDGMGQAFSELERARPLIIETLKLEEIRFRETLARGLNVLEEATRDLALGEDLPGEVAFKLYDTFGFPLDLTQDALKNEGRGVDQEGFDSAMEAQRAAARAAWTGSGDEKTEALWFDLRQSFGATEFLGYEIQEAEGRVEALIANGDSVNTATEGTELLIILNQTPFYGESGGQQGDCGIFSVKDSTEITIRDTQKKLGDLHIHNCLVTRGEINVGDVVDAKVDREVRDRLRANHSATHLLHSALRISLGEHITQKGSLVAPDRLRFDISHNKAITAEELSKIESEVNQKVRENSLVSTLLMTPDEAVEQGALALFGEKYGDEVRVVSMGDQFGKNYSTELCGGTHVNRTGDIGFFKILGESSVSAGVRRIEALTGSAAVGHILEQSNILRDAAKALKTSTNEIPARLEGLLEEKRKFEREASDLRRKLATGSSRGNLPSKHIDGIRFVSNKVEDAKAGELKSMIDDLKKTGSGIYALISINEGKASLVVGVSPDLTDRFNAVTLVRRGVEVLGGKGGGGRSDMAQGGGPDGLKADAALLAIEEGLSNQA